MLTTEGRCELPGTPRSTYYYKPKPKGPAVDERREAAMRAIGDIRLEMPFAGARKISKELERMGFPYGGHATKALMDEMNVRPVYPKPNLSRPRKGAKEHPYLLKNKKILLSNQVWATDITHVPIGKTHMCLVAVIDRYSRYIAGWRLLDDMGAAGAVACMRDAIGAHGAPAIASSDQGSAYSSAAYGQLLKDAHVLQSMDGCVHGERLGRRQQDVASLGAALRERRVQDVGAAARQREQEPYDERGVRVGHVDVHVRQHGLLAVLADKRDLGVWHRQPGQRARDAVRVRELLGVDVARLPGIRPFEPDEPVHDVRRLLEPCDDIRRLDVGSAFERAIGIADVLQLQLACGRQRHDVREFAYGVHVHAD